MRQRELIPRLLRGHQTVNLNQRQLQEMFSGQNVNLPS
jgi:hypothetical protein